MEMETKEYYVTSDLNLASVLLSLNFAVDGVDVQESDKQRVNFYFEKGLSLLDVINKYYERKLRIEPNDLFNARREILSRIHAQNSQKPDND